MVDEMKHHMNKNEIGLMGLISARDKRIAELAAANAREKERMKLIMSAWGSDFSAGYDAGYALAKFDHGIDEDTAE